MIIIYNDKSAIISMPESNICFFFCTSFCKLVTDTQMSAGK